MKLDLSIETNDVIFWVGAFTTATKRWPQVGDIIELGMVEKKDGTSRQGPQCEVIRLEKNKMSFVVKRYRG